MTHYPVIIIIIKDKVRLIDNLAIKCCCRWGVNMVGEKVHRITSETDRFHFSLFGSGP